MDMPRFEPAMMGPAPKVIANVQQAVEDVEIQMVWAEMQAHVLQLSSLDSLLFTVSAGHRRSYLSDFVTVRKCTVPFVPEEPNVSHWSHEIDRWYALTLRFYLRNHFCFGGLLRMSTRLLPILLTKRWRLFPKRVGRLWLSRSYSVNQWSRSFGVLHFLCHFQTNSAALSSECGVAWGCEAWAGRSKRSSSISNTDRLV